MNDEQQSSLLLLGVGGGGCRMAAAVLAATGPGLRVLGLDTDAMANRDASANGLTTLLLGGSRLSGQGTGGDPIMGRLALQDDLANVNTHLVGVRTVVLMTCLGGGTGGGVTPELVKALHDQGILTLCFVTRPFAFEPDARRRAADRVVPMIEEHSDSLVVFALDDLFTDAGEERVEAAIPAANRLLASGVTLLWRLIATPGFISLDTERLHRLILKGGNAGFGCAVAEGADRAGRVVKALCENRLLRNGDALHTANALLIGILAGGDLRLAEVGAVMEALHRCCKSTCAIEMGTVLDRAYEGRIELVALTFESWTALGEVAPPVETDVALQPPPVAESFPIQSGSRRRGRTSKLAFGATGRGRFRDVEPTLLGGQDLDTPTYARRGITLDR